MNRTGLGQDKIYRTLRTGQDLKDRIGYAWTITTENLFI
jgi:hypothetical protein